MASLKGRRELEKFERGEKLTWKQAIRAQCYVCNGLDEGLEDCQGASCPLYTFFPYKGVKGHRNAVAVTEGQNVDPVS